MIQDIIDQLDAEGGDFNKLAQFYADMESLQNDLGSWALGVAGTMLKRTSDADYRAWLKLSETINRGIKTKLREAGTGVVFDTLQREQEELIKTIPSYAAESVHAMAEDAMRNGQRFEDLVTDIKSRWRDLGEFKARRIARTECSRARANFTEARAKAIGSPGYIWRTSGDGRVRPMHAKLNGTFHRWDEPPACDIGKGGELIHSHPGAVFNCRCVAQPLFPESLFDD